MKLYTVVHQGRTLVCLETQGGTLVPLPYQSMNHLLMDEPESRDAVLIGSDIRLEDDSLCYPGTIQLTVREQWR